jgi:hypothetical protein
VREEIKFILEENTKSVPCPRYRLHAARAEPPSSGGLPRPRARWTRAQVRAREHTHTHASH